MKKSPILLLALACVLLLCACSNNSIPNEVHSASDLEGKRIGVIADSAAEITVGGYSSVTMVSYDSWDALAEDLRTGGIDCAVTDSSVAKANITGKSGLKTLPDPLLAEDYMIAVAKENPDLLKDINAALKTLAENGVISGITDGYLGLSEYKYESPHNPGDFSASLILSVSSGNPPYEYYDENGDMAGVDIDVARAVCDILGVGLEVEDVDEAKLVYLVQIGQTAFSMGRLTGAESDRELVDFSDSYYNSTQVIVVRKK